MKKRVFVIDYNIVSPIGIGKDKLKKSLKNNFSAEKIITNFIHEGLELHVGAEISEDLKFLYSSENKKIKELAQYDRKFELLLAVYKLMEKNLKFLTKNINPNRAGVILGVGADASFFSLFQDFLEYEIDEETIKKLTNSDLLFPYDFHSVFLAERLNLATFQKTVLTACSSSTQAIGLATQAIRNGKADIVIAGGTDSIINLIAFISFYKLGALAPQSEPIGKTCKPFDINRNGTLASEAAGLCVLVSEDFIKQNNINPAFEIIGYGSSLDAYRITAPAPDGKGMKRAIEQAIADANINLKEIDYINAHGTGTPLNDEAEAKAFNDVFGKSLADIHISSTKDRHGHAIAAAGVLEFAVLLSSMEENLVPCTINLEKPIKQEYFYPVLNENIKKEINVGMTCNYAFGGVNASLIVKKLKKWN